MPLCDTFEVDSPSVKYAPDSIEAEYEYCRTEVRKSDGGGVRVVPVTDSYTIQTDRRVPKTGVMFVGWGGNNGSTTTAMVMANAAKMEWETKRGSQVLCSPLSLPPSLFALS